MHEFKLLNESPEELPEYGQFLEDSAFINPILEVLEKGIRTKVGDLPIDYFSGRQIDQLNLVVSPYRNFKDQFKEYIARQKAYYARFKREHKRDHQYLVTVDSRFSEPGLFQNQEGVNLHLKVKIKEKGSGKVFSGWKKYHFIVQAPDQLRADLKNKTLAAYQSFPLNKEEIQKAFIGGLEEIFFQEENPKKHYVERTEYEQYYDFMLESERAYSLIVPVPYGYSTLSNVKNKFLGIPLLSGKSKYSQLLAGDLSDPKRGRIQMKERRVSGLTDLDVEDPSGVAGFRKLNRAFWLHSELSPPPYDKYLLKGSITEAYALGIRIGDPFENFFKLELYSENNLLKSEIKVYNLGVTVYDEGNEGSMSSFSLGPVGWTKTNGGAKRLDKMLRDHGRIYTPYLKAEGSLNGRPFAMVSNPLCLNNVELYFGDEMVGLLTHTKPTKKQLKRKKNVVPHVLYLKGGLSTEEEALVLQSFQMLRIGYAMNSLHRGRRQTN